MGHSFGALIALVFAANHPALPGVLVSSPLLRLAVNLSFSKKLGKKIAGPISKISPTKTIDMVIEQNLLTSDIKILRKHISDDKKLEKISLRSAAEMERAMKWAMENASKLLCPILVMQAGKDKMVEKGTTKEFFEKIKSKDKTYREYDGFLHELWNEKGREQVFRDIFVWLEKHIKKK